MTQDKEQKANTDIVPPPNFIRNIIREDELSGKHGGRVPAFEVGKLVKQYVAGLLRREVFGVRGEEQDRVEETVYGGRRDLV